MPHNIGALIVEFLSKLNLEVWFFRNEYFKFEGFCRWRSHTVQNFEASDLTFPSELRALLWMADAARGLLTNWRLQVTSMSKLKLECGTSMLKLKFNFKVVFEVPEVTHVCTYMEVELMHPTQFEVS